MEYLLIIKDDNGLSDYIGTKDAIMELMKNYNILSFKFLKTITDLQSIQCGEAVLMKFEIVTPRRIEIVKDFEI